MPAIQPKIDHLTPQSGNRNVLLFAISLSVLILTVWYFHSYRIEASDEFYVAILLVPVIIGVEACLTALSLYRLIQERVRRFRTRG